MPANSILIVDDTPNNIRLLFDVLDSAGFEISVVKSGETALEKLPYIKPDLILLDIMMPGIDGFETCRRIKSNPDTADIPIIFMTALTDTENKVFGLQSGAVDYITKPIQVEEVLARVNIHLNLRNIQTKLQQEVQERQQAELKLQENITSMQQMQIQLVQNEKMSALGNLVAGVAHEMNNPLGFISATLKQTKPNFSDISDHLKLYQQTYPNPTPEILEHAEEIDIEYSLEDFPKMLDAMVIACDRLKNISTSLRTFSRADKDHKVPFNIHQGIDSTILILKHRLKASEQRPAIEVITEYGNLPQINCFPGQLNQVFMNILANAIDALDEANIGKSYEEIQVNPNKIIIKTSIENNHAKISIRDNGQGMTAEIKQKIFDHLFTTKGVGKGTGLGLAIARQIIEETHAGKLSCTSQLGLGTEFVIYIPQ